MVLLTRINKQEQFYLNEDLIEFMEETPDTMISMQSGRKVVVAETAAQVVELIYTEKSRQLNARPPRI